MMEVITMLELRFTNGDIKTLARKAKQSYKLNAIVEIAQLVFSDADMLTEFVKAGAKVSEKEADDLIQVELDNGRDYQDVQKDVIEGLIASNFYKAELTEFLAVLNGKLK